MKREKIIVILPAYNEEPNIRTAIEEFFSTGVVDEIIVVNNRSTDGTAIEVKKTTAILVNEDKAGYGWAMRRGMYEAWKRKADIIITCEPDGTFNANDIHKLLVYGKEFDAVFGTRTAKEFIWEEANMSHFLRFGNWFVAKYLEYLHNGPCLTDVGCSFKLIKPSLYIKIKDRFTIGGSSFSPELMIECIRHGTVTEIPLTYKGRVGESKITGNKWKAFKLGLEMMYMILAKRCGYGSNIHRLKRSGKDTAFS